MQNPPEPTRAVGPNEHPAWDHVRAKAELFTALSDRVWATPELNYAEWASAEAHRAALDAQGFRVTTGVAGLPTAMMGEAGQGGPVIAILGEFDALPGLSQEAGTTREQPVERGGNGHGCGHNLLGAGSLAAATAVKDWLTVTGLPGRVRYCGCPAEEGGSAKGFMVRAGVFDDVHVAASWHPAPFAGVNKPVSLACNEIDFQFFGRSAHAAAAPHLGRSALDAVELMNVGVNYLREHMPPTARIHYALIDAGGMAPNVVQARATVRYLIRERDLPRLRALIRRVRRIAVGAALMSGARMRATVLSGDAELVANPPLERLMQAHLERLGPPPFDAADHAFAARIQDSLSPEDIAAAYERFGAMRRQGQTLCDTILPLGSGDGASVGSTDVGTVSWVVPTVQMRGATHAIGTPGHSWQVVAQGKTPAAHKGTIHAAMIMASTAADLLADPALIAEATTDHRARLAETPFVNPIPDDVEPPLVQAR